MFRDAVFLFFSSSSPRLDGSVDTEYMEGEPQIWADWGRNWEVPWMGGPRQSLEPRVGSR